MDIDQRFFRLFAQLVNIEQAADAGQDQLRLSIEALACVTEFIEGNESVAQTGATRSLHRLAWALKDLDQGTEPSLFAGKKRTGRPSVPSEKFLQGELGALADALFTDGASRQEAAECIEKVARRAGLKFKGVPITSEMVIGWRAEMDRRGARLKDLVFRGATDLDRAESRDEMQRNRFVAERVVMLLNLGF